MLLYKNIIFFHKPIDKLIFLCYNINVTKRLQKQNISQQFNGGIFMEYIITITYNFDSGYFAQKCFTREDALKTLRELLDNEIKIVKSESGYTPSVLNFYDDDITLVYAEGYSINDMGRSFAQEDCAFYRIFEV